MKIKKFIILTKPNRIKTLEYIGEKPAKKILREFVSKAWLIHYLDQIR